MTNQLKSNNVNQIFDLQTWSTTHSSTRVTTTFDPAFILKGAKLLNCWAAIRFPEYVDVYSSDNTSKPMLSFGSGEDFFGHIVFDAFLMPNYAHHFCDRNQKVGKNNCAIPVVAQHANGTKYFPFFKFPKANGDIPKPGFRTGLHYEVGGKLLTVKNTPNGNQEVSIVDQNSNYKLIGLVGINDMSPYYLIPLVLPERRVIYFATDEDTIKDWHNKVNISVSNKSLVAGVNTQAFDDDDLEISITFDCDLNWI